MTKGTTGLYFATPETSKARAAAARGLRNKGTGDTDPSKKPGWLDWLLPDDATPDAGTLQDAIKRGDGEFRKQVQY